MREIKFRLRDRHNKIVGYEKWYVGEWFFDNDANMHPDSGYWRASPCWLYSIDNENWTPTFIPHRYKDQFTGLKDKNGKEIYEGDIVYDYLAQGRGLVEFGCFVIGKDDWGVEHKTMGFAVRFTDTNEDWTGLDNSCDFEVIGNIYENQELLEV